MPLFRLVPDALLPIPETGFALEDLTERGDLQRRLRDRPEAIEPGLFIVSEEYGEWDESKRRIDLLGLDSDGNIVVVELKRTEQDVFMDLQALRYAALVSAMTFEDLVRAHERYLSSRLVNENARERLLKFLDTGGEEEVQIGSSPRIILVAPSFSKELTTSVLWLMDQQINIKCVQMRPLKLGDDILVDFAQVIPLPQASDYIVKIRQKVEAVRSAQERGRRERTIRILIRAEKIKPGDIITFLPSVIGRETLEGSDPTYRAKFVDDIAGQKNVLWERDQNLYSLSTLSENMRDNHGVPIPRGGINGYTC